MSQKIQPTNQLEKSWLSNNELLLAAEDIASKAGKRFTPIRRHVYLQLLQAERPMGAYELLPSLEGIGASKPPTIYRSLEWLHELGLIRKIANNAKFTVIRTGLTNDPVAFVVCRDCGQTDELTLDDNIGRIFSRAEDQGYSDFNSTIELSGKCLECSGNSLAGQ